MSVEEDLLNMLKHIKFSPPAAMAEMARACEFGILKQLKAMIDKRIEDYAKSGVGGMDSFTETMDPFTILGVSMDASEEEVRDAYRKKAFEVHPDRGGSNLEMAKVNAAWETIRKFRGWTP